MAAATKEGTTVAARQRERRREHTPPSASCDLRSLRRHARAGIPRFGSHRFRHALACDLLARGAPLKEIGELLRHASQDTTAIYAKADIGRLAGLAMPCPQGEAL